MISAVLSVAFGALSWVGAPVVTAVLGLALGANAILMEARRVPRRPQQRNLGIIGAAVSALAVAVFFLRRALR